MPRPARSPRNSAAAPSTPWRWALAGLCLGVLPALLLWAPARWLAGTVTQASGAQVQLVNARGTVWQGSALLLLTGGAGSHDRAALPTRLQWRLRPTWTGLQAWLQSDCCTPAPLRLYAQPGWGSVRLELADGHSQWPAALLAGLGTPWNTLQPQGQLQLATTGLRLQWTQGRTSVQGRAQLDALAMSTSLSTLRPMGSYRLQLEGGSAAQLTLSTLGGALLLSGSGHWVGQRLRFTGEASAAPGREAALANLLNIIGRRNGARSLITVG